MQLQFLVDGWMNEWMVILLVGKKGVQNNTKQLKKKGHKSSIKNIYFIFLLPSSHQNFD